MSDSSSIMTDKSTITRAFAWARAYLAVQNTMAAKMCLCRVMKSTVPSDSEDHGQDAVQLATEIAMQYMQGGNFDEAAQLLWCAASWARGEPDVGSEAQEVQTVIARSPLTHHVASAPSLESEDEISERAERTERTMRSVRTVRVKPKPRPGDLDKTVGRFEEDVTRIYRPGQSRAVSGTVTTNTVVRFRPNVDRVS